MLVRPPFRVASAAAAGYPVDYSALFNGASVLTLTPGAVGNRKTFTISAWVKYVPGTDQCIFSAGVAGVSTSQLRFLGDAIQWQEWNGALVTELKTTALFRDPGAWYHIVFVYDSTQGTADNRLRLWVNGVEITSFSARTNPGPSQDSEEINNTVQHEVGRNAYGGGSSIYLASYLAEFRFIGGYGVPAADLGQSDVNTNNWVPKAYAGSYGTNSCYQNYADALDFGKDVSGLGNHFTKSGTIFHSEDTPTNNHGSKFNPLTPASLAGTVTYSEGNGKITTSAASFHGSHLAFKIPDSGKYYLEFENSTLTAGSPCASMGVIDPDVAMTGNHATMPGFWGFNWQGARYLNLNGTSTSVIAPLAANTRTQLFIDVDNDKLFLGIANSWYDTVSTTAGNPSTGANPTASGIGLAGKMIMAGTYGAMDMTVYEEADWAYTAPTDGLALTTDNLPAMTATGTDQDVGQHIHTALVSHDGTSTNFTCPWPVEGAGAYHTKFETKNRDAVEKWFIVDTLRGLSKIISSNLPDVETTDVNVISASGSTVTLGSTLLANNYVVTCYRAGLIGSETSGTTDDGKAYEYSANPTFGFSIVKYVGSGLAGHNIPHGLGAVLKEVEIKDLDQSINWVVGHVSIGWTKYLHLNLTNAAAAGTFAWNDTDPTDTVFTLGTWGNLNTLNNNHVAYCFAESDFIKIGSYTGNGAADGPMITENISTEFSFVKRTNTTGNWGIQDSARSPYNPVDKVLIANLDNAEQTLHDADFVTTGVKRRNAGTDVNASSSTYAHMMIGQPTGASGSAEATGR